MLDKVFDPPPSMPGAGIAAMVAFVLLVGLLMRAYVVRRIFRFGEWILKQIPLVKTLYGSMRDLMGFFASSKEGGPKSQVVMVHVAGLRLLGLLTRDDFKDLPDGLGDSDSVTDRDLDVVESGRLHHALSSPSRSPRPCSYATPQPTQQAGVRGSRIALHQVSERSAPRAAGRKAPCWASETGIAGFAWCLKPVL